MDVDVHVEVGVVDWEGEEADETGGCLGAFAILSVHSLIRSYITFVGEPHNFQ